MNQKSKSLPRWAQWAAGLALLATALTAGGLSLAVNVIAGLGVGLAVAIAYGLADCGKLLLPIVCQAIGWKVHTLTAYIVVSIVSILCAICYLADMNGGDLIQREHAVAAHADQAEEIERMEAYVASLRGMAANEAARGGCGPNCQAIQQRADKAAEKLQEARSAKPSQPAALPGSAVLAAAVAGSDADQAAKQIAIAKSIAALAVMELLAHLAGAAAALIGMAMRKPEIAIAKPVEAVAKPASQAVAKLKAEAIAIAKPKAGSAAYYLQRLRAEHPQIAAMVDRKELSVYAASIQAGLRKAPKKSAKNWASVEAYAKPEKVQG